VNTQQMQTAQAVFDRYEQLRFRLPENVTRPGTQDISSLWDIRSHADAFVFDAFGVLNVGDVPIPGAAQRLDELRKDGCHIRVLSNAASFDKAHSIRKFRNLGLNLEDDEIVTSRDATLDHVDDRLWGAIAAEEDNLSDLNGSLLRVADDPDLYDQVDGFVFLSSADWSFERQARLESALRKRPRTVLIANADLAAPRGGRFSLEPGYFGHRIADLGNEDTRFFGKPYPEVYTHLSHSLRGVSPDRIVMCGDSPHTDILGAAAQGWGTVLVTKDGLFSDICDETLSQRSGIHPVWRLKRI